MKLNNKGFSLVELLGVMVILGIVLGLSIAQYRRHIYETIQKSYDLMAENMEYAAENYFIDHPLETSVTVEDLVELNYIEPVNDPSRQANDDDLCEGKIRKKTIEGEEEGALDKSELAVSVCCIDYAYTYRYPSNEKTKDKYCKVYPYDIKKIKNIKVLNVYPAPAYANNVSSWMSTYGKGLIQVAPVYIDDFNANPEHYLIDSEGNWKYDVVIFGFADCNGGKDLNTTSKNLTAEYMEQGGSVIFGHDTIIEYSGGHPNFRSLAKYVNIENYKPWSWVGKNKVIINRKGIFTTYPYDIGEEGTVLTIPTSHTSGQRANGDVWLVFDGIADDASKVYLTTYGNNAMIQIGHSNGAATPDEQKILTNIIFYTLAKQYVEED